MEIVGPGETVKGLAFELSMEHCSSNSIFDFLSGGVVGIVFDSLEAVEDEVSLQVLVKLSWM